MQKDWQWNQKSLKCIQKQSHSSNLIGLCKHTPNTFYTSSQDCTVRLWDIRTQSSIKLIRHKQLTPQLSNPACDGHNQLFIGSGPNVYKFDIRSSPIFVEEYGAYAQQPHYDNINQIVYSQRYRQILCCDDQGDIRAYSTNTNTQKIQCKNRLQQQHTNICNCIEYIYSQNKQFQNKKLCVSGGFDSTLIIWDIQQQKPIKKIPIIDLLHKYGISTQNQDYPFIHTIYAYGSSALVGIQSGFILCIPLTQPKKPKFILQANLTRITDCIVGNVMGRNIMIASAVDKSFSLFDYQHRVNGEPVFLQKYATVTEPVQVEVVGNSILVVCQSPALSIYQIKG